MPNKIQSGEMYKTTELITPMKYKDMPEPICPICHSEDVEVTPEGVPVQAYAKCGDCEARWTVVYEINGYQDLEQGPKPVIAYYLVEVTFDGYDTEIDRDLERILRRQSSGGGFGFGERDISWTYKTLTGARNAANKLKGRRKQTINSVKMTAVDKYYDDIYTEIFKGSDDEWDE